MARANHVKHARKDYPEHDIKKGEPYYWWKFRNSPKQFSKTPPRPQQLTQSGYMSSVFDLNDTQNAICEEFADCKKKHFNENFESSVDEWKSAAEELRDGCQESLDNMPEHLQDTSSSGELLTERIESLESYISEIEGIEHEVEKRHEIEDRLSEVENVTLE